jgi:heme/copper-type cytochrome/quinol oxidase subunit 4
LRDVLETWGSVVEKREIVALSLLVVYLGACVLALWHRLDAILLLAVASPVAASFMFPKGANRFSRLLIGFSIDAFLAALAFVPVMGDLIDLGASVVAVVLLATRFRQFAASLPGGLACVVLYLFLWFETSLLPRQLSVSAAHHGFWVDPTAIVAVSLVGGAILAGLAALLSLCYDGDRAKAVFCAIGFPWYLATFFFTVFLPNSDVKKAHEAARIARRSSY